MGNLRPRFNKAREEQLRRQRAGKRKSADTASEDHGAAGNAEIIVPKTAEQKERERQMRATLEQNAKSGNMSSRKRRRMDNYVNKKLKTERRGELFKSLSASQETMSTPLLLQPSSTLGSKQFKTNMDKLDRVGTLTDRKHQRAVDALVASKRVYHSDGSDEEDARLAEDDADSSEVDVPSQGNKVRPSASSSQHPEGVSSRDRQDESVSANFNEYNQSKRAQSPPSIGSGLKRDESGQPILPTIFTRKRKVTAKRRFGKQPAQQTEPDSEESFFDSSDSSENETGDGDDDVLSSEGSDDYVDDGEEWAGISGENPDTSPADEPGMALKVTPYDHSGVPINDPGAGAVSEKSRFKDWANAQLGLTVRTTQGHSLDFGATSVQKRPVQSGPVYGPLGEDLALPETSLLDITATAGQPSKAGAARKAVVLVERSTELQESRLQLPILAEEDAIMEAIRQHSVVVLCGETGSGKTTQVPQFLYEAGFGNADSDNPGMIGVTQPRRVAAMAMAARVADELSLPPSKVSYQIRYDATVSVSTCLKFMTDGVLMRELANDFLLNKYSVIIIDEAHERSINTDVLIGTLSRVIRLREEMWRKGQDDAKPLRLVIMSATLRVSDFTANPTLFKTPPPLINVAARQHPVAVHFNRKTRPDYLAEAYKKVSKIHARLPPGGILVFLTGQKEIATLCRRLGKRFSSRAILERSMKRKRTAFDTSGISESHDDEVDSDKATLKLSNGQADVEAEEIDLGYDPAGLADDVDGVEAVEDPEALDSDLEDDGMGDFGDMEEDCDDPMHILPLYSLLPSEKQMLVFKPPPENHRLVVIATNVAETSLTIPNIRYVVDCGRAKERNYDASSGIQSFDISWISKASAAQRAGRAGRTGPGHCYRLYSSAVFETHCPAFSLPEIMRMPIEGIVLQMKAMNIDSVINFPFPTPPDRAALQEAERVLVNLGALAVQNKAGAPSQPRMSRITELGVAMSLFPLSPRFSKMLVVGQQHQCLPYVIAAVSALSVGDPFLREDALGYKDSQEEETDGGIVDRVNEAEVAELAFLHNEDHKAKQVRKLQRRGYFQVRQQHAALGNCASDIFQMLSVVGAYEYEGASPQFCERNFVRHKAMQEIHQLRLQISKIVEANYPGISAGFAAKLKPPNDVQLKVLRQLLMAAFIDQVAIRKDLVSPGEIDGSRYTSTRGVAYRAVGIDEDVFIHPSSVLFHSPPPECIVYQELIRTSRVYVKGNTKVNTAWLPSLGKPLCTFSRILETTDDAGIAQMSATVKKLHSAASDQRECYVVPKFADFDMLKLDPIKATQKRVGSRWVFV